MKNTDAEDMNKAQHESLSASKSYHGHVRVDKGTMDDHQFAVPFSIPKRSTVVSSTNSMASSKTKSSAHHNVSVQKSRIRPTVKKNNFLTNGKLDVELLNVPFKKIMGSVLVTKLNTLLNFAKVIIFKKFMNGATRFEIL